MPIFTRIFHPCQPSVPSYKRRIQGDFCPAKQPSVTFSWLGTAQNFAEDYHTLAHGTISLALIWSTNGSKVGSSILSSNETVSVEMLLVASAKRSMSR